MRAISVMSALAQPTRLEVFGQLAREGVGGLTAGKLAARTGAAANTMTAHLTVLKVAGLVTAERAGRNVIYRADTTAVRELTEFLTRQCYTSGSNRASGSDPSRPDPGRKSRSGRARATD